MEAFASSVPVIDEDAVAALRELGDDLLREVISVFISDAPAAVEEIAGAARHGDAEAMFIAAHRLRSVAANSGALRLALLCDEVQERGWAGAVIDQETVERLSAELTLALTSLEKVTGSR